MEYLEKYGKLLAEKCPDETLKFISKIATTNGMDFLFYQRNFVYNHLIRRLNLNLFWDYFLNFVLNLFFFSE